MGAETYVSLASTDKNEATTLLAQSRVVQRTAITVAHDATGVLQRVG
jgi:hypothetical protein